MNKIKITYWKNENSFLGYINDYTEYNTQGDSLEDLIENLKDIYQDIIDEKIPGVRKTLELELV